MPKIRFSKSRPDITVPQGANLMQSLLDAGLPVASSCFGRGICTKCRVQIVEGAENLTPETSFEKEFRRRNRIAEGFRISCQVSVEGDVTVDTPYW